MPEEPASRDPSDTPADVGLSRAALAVRDIVGLLAERDVTTPDLDAVVAELRPLVERWSTFDLRGPSAAGGRRGWRRVLLPDETFDLSGDDVAVFTTTVGPGFDGPEGGVHPGVLAFVFDNVASYTASHWGPGSVFTGTLEITYVTPAPAADELRFTGWIESVEGRKVVVGSEVRRSDQLVATSRAVMIQPRTGTTGG